MHIWNVLLQTMECSFTAHDERMITVAFSPDDRLVASSTLGSDDSQVRLWNIQELTEIGQICCDSVNDIQP